MLHLPECLTTRCLYGLDAMLWLPSPHGAAPCAVLADWLKVSNGIQPLNAIFSIACSSWAVNSWDQQAVNISSNTPQGIGGQGG